MTGASGEMGHTLVHRLADAGVYDVLAIDVRPLDPDVARRCSVATVGNILDRHLLDRLRGEFEIHVVFHLAALLSTRAEFVPETAYDVNVHGTLNLLALAMDEARAHGSPVKFLFPSSIAVYGLPDAATKHAVGRVREQEWTHPVTMYGVSKLTCEHLGRYFSEHYRQLAANPEPGRIDFRAIRFPGLISAFTLPSGGTSDYAPEMIHAGAQGRSYACFVREDTRIPFMAMPDAIDALLALMDAPRDALSTRAYNVGSFNPTAGEFARMALAAFPAAKVTFEPDPRRQAIVDSWPEDVDDTLARRDWGFAPAHDLRRTFDAYLVPNIVRRYAGR